MLHAIWYMMSVGHHVPAEVNKDNILEEKIVTYMATGLCTVIQQNPKLFKKIVDIYNVN